MTSREQHPLVAKIMESVVLPTPPAMSEGQRLAQMYVNFYNALAREAAKRSISKKRLSEIGEEQGKYIIALKLAGRSWSFDNDAQEPFESRELILQANAEEVKYHMAGNRYALLYNRYNEIQRTAEAYVMRLEDMERMIIREKNHIEYGYTTYLGNEMWSSSAAMDLPRLSIKLSTLLDDYKSYVKEEW